MLEQKFSLQTSWASLCCVVGCWSAQGDPSYHAAASATRSFIMRWGPDWMDASCCHSCAQVCLSVYIQPCATFPSDFLERLWYICAVGKLKDLWSITLYLGQTSLMLLLYAKFNWLGHKKGLHICRMRALKSPLSACNDARWPILLLFHWFSSWRMLLLQQHYQTKLSACWPIKM